MNLLSILKKIVRKDKYGSSYVLRSEVDNIRLNKKEQQELEKLMKERNIRIREKSDLVQDFDFGIKEAYGISNFDKPKYADLRFSNTGELIYEDYQKLDEFLEDFIELNITIKKRIDPKTGEIIYFKSIPLNSIIRLKLSEIEQKYVLNYLSKKNIRVCGHSKTLDNNFANYDCTIQYSTINLPKPLTEKELEEKFELFKLTKDPKIRQELILHNTRIVPYALFKYARFYDVDRTELESYAYEGLIEAVDKFDNSKGVRFVTFATNYIVFYIKRGYQEIKSDGRSSFSESYLKAKRTIEKKYNTTLEESPDLLEEILDFLIENKKISVKNKERIERRINMLNPLSLDDTDDILNPENDIENIDEELTTKSLKMLLVNLFSVLTIEEEMIIIYLYGLNGNKYSYEEIAKEFNMPVMIIKQIEKRIFRKLRNSAYFKKIKNNYNGNLSKKGKKLL